MATASQFTQCYARSPESVRGAWESACQPCLARFCAGARQVIRHGVGFALYCPHEARLLIARPILDDQIELSLAGPLSESAATEAIRAANADGQRLVFQQHHTH